MSSVAVGFDIGGTHARAAAVWHDGAAWHHGEVRKERWRDEAATADPEALAACVARLRDAVQADAPEAAGAIGIGIASQLDRSGDIVRNAPNLGWRDLPLADLLEARLGVRPAIVNDVNAILLGELHFGAAMGAEDVLAVYWGTGIGGALAVDGRLVVGAGGNAGEIGHVKVRGRAALCGCGEVGCLEAFAGGAALLRTIAAAGSELPAGARAMDDVVAAAATGHAGATAFVDGIVADVGHVIAGACTLLNPQVLLLGGGVLDRCPSLVEALSSTVSTLTLAVSRADLEVRSGALGDLSGPLGAGALALVRRRESAVWSG